MTRLRLLSAVALVAALALAPFIVAPQQQQAQAAAAVMCQGDVSGASTGARVVVNTSSTTTPQPSYVLNSAGCAVIQQVDIGFFQSLGFTAGSPFGQPIITTTGVWTGTTDIVLGVLPAGAVILAIEMTNSTANAVTGGVSIGSTANGVDIVVATVCAANCVANSALVKTGFSLTAATTLHAAPVTAGNNANVTITVLWAYF